MKKSYKFGILAIILIITGLRMYNKYEKQQIRKENEQKEREFLESYRKDQKQKENAAYLLQENRKLDSINTIQKKEQDKKRQELKENIKNLEQEIQNK